MRAAIIFTGFIFSLITTTASANPSAGIVGNNIHNSGTGSMPPGLNSQTPRGLIIHHRSPAGWSHGNKTGWSKTVKTKTVKVHKNP